MFKDSLFKKIEDKTKVNKDTILSLASKLQQTDMKNENSLRSFIKEVASITGKEVTKEKEDKLVNAIISDRVPKNVDKMF